MSRLVPELDAPPPEPRDLTLVRAQLDRVEIGVGKQEGSETRFLTIGPFLLELVVPLTPDVARSIGQHLTGGLVIASQVPRMDIPQGRP